MNEFKIRRKKEINFILILNFFKCLVFAFMALFIIFISTGGKLFTFKHVLLYSIYSIPLCLLYAFMVERFGNFFGRVLYGWSSKRASPRETLSADLAKAKFSKTNGRFKEALTIVNEVLEKDPDFPDALYIKAVILWEGFENRQDASRYLRKVMALVPRNETLHRWASNYLRDITKPPQAN
jgi:tetratricopeptide (TPR) repeat protein